MKVTFLGTGTSQGIPVVGSDHPVCQSKNHKDKRLRVSVLIEIDNLSIVIDCGPDFRQQMLRSQCAKVDAILYTHEHSDHTAGLDDIRPFFFKQGAINIYSHERVLNSLKQRFDYIFKTENRYPGAPSVNAQIIKNSPFKVEGLEVIPVDGLHGTLQVFGYRLKNFAYLTDFKTITDIELKKLQNLDVLVVNALREHEHRSHFTLTEALALIEKLKPKRAYLTHISSFLGFHDEVEAKLPENVFLAYDELSINIPTH